MDTDDTISTHPALLPSASLHFEGRYSTITQLSAFHAPDLFAELGGTGPSQVALWQYMFDGPYATLSALTADMEKQATSTDPSFYTILDNATGKATGRMALMRIDAKNRVIELGHVVFGPSLQRTRAATDAVVLLMRYVFEELGYRRLEWKCNAANGASRRAAERFGFVTEGVFRQHMIQRGKNRDTAWFAMLDWEWEGRKRGFEGWLGDENFDEEGRQRRRLEDFWSSPCLR